MRQMTESHSSCPGHERVRERLAMLAIGLMTVAIPGSAEAQAILVRDIEQQRQPHLPPPCPAGGPEADPGGCPLPDPAFGSLPTRLTSLGERVVFLARDGIHGLEPWVTDGTAAGSFMLADLAAGAADSSFVPLAVVGHRLVFWATSTIEPAAAPLWVTDGSPAGTLQLQLPCAGACDHPPATVSPPWPLHATLDGGLYFLAPGGRFLFRTDGVGVEIVHDFCQGDSSCRARIEEVVASEHSLFVIEKSPGEPHWRVVRLDGGPLEQVLADCSWMESVTPFAAGLLFLGGCAGQRAGLYAVDAGNEPGPRLVHPLGSGSLQGDLLVAEGGVYISELDPPGWNLWYSDGSRVGTRQVASFEHVVSWVTLGTSLIVAGSPRDGQEAGLWRIEPSGTRELLLDHPVVTVLTVAAGRVFFGASDAAHGVEPWMTDGTARGTVLLADINPGPASSNPTVSGNGVSGFAVAGDHVFVAAHHPAYDIELWKLPLDGEPSPARCLPDDHTLCLADRFRVMVSWRDSRSELSAGHAVHLTRDTGAFWFFAPSNLELLVKVLDACAPPWERYWIFAGGLTNLDVTLRVDDLVAGESREYHNPFGSAFQAIQDTRGFATCP